MRNLENLELRQDMDGYVEEIISKIEDDKTNMIKELNRIYICGCLSEEKVEKDCYFYHEEYHMGGSIDICSYHGTLGKCPCKNCDKYIKQSEASGIVRKYVDGKKGS